MKKINRIICNFEVPVLIFESLEEVGKHTTPEQVVKILNLYALGRLRTEGEDLIREGIGKLIGGKVEDSFTTEEAIKQYKVDTEKLQALILSQPPFKASLNPKVRERKRGPLPAKYKNGALAYLTGKKDLQGILLKLKPYGTFAAAEGKDKDCASNVEQLGWLLRDYTHANDICA